MPLKTFNGTQIDKENAGDNTLALEPNEQEAAQEAQLSELEAQNKAAQEQMDRDFFETLKKEDSPAPNPLNTGEQEATQEAQEQSTQEALSSSTPQQSKQASEQEQAAQPLSSGALNNLRQTQSGLSFLSTGNDALDEQISSGQLSAYDMYLMKKMMGIDVGALFKEATQIQQNELKLAGDSGSLGLNLNQKIKKMGVDSEIKALRDIENAKSDVLSIAGNREGTSGWWNALARGFHNLGGKYTWLSADEGNVNRMVDDANLALSYPLAMTGSSRGGTGKERQDLREDIEFSGLNEKETLNKADYLLKQLDKRKANVIASLEEKQFSLSEAQQAAYGSGEFQQQYLRNYAAQKYLQEHKDKGFKDDEFAEAYTYGKFFETKKGK